MASPTDARTPPHSEEAERCLLGALLLDPGRIPEVADLVRPEDYFSPRHAALWEAILGLVERSSPVDLVTLGEALNQAGTFQQVGGRAYLVELMAAAGSSAHVKHHAKVVSDTSTLRRLIRECSEVVGEAYATRADGTAVQDLVVSAEDRVFRLAAHKDRGEALPIGKAVIETFRRIDSASHRRGLTGLPSGYYELDELLCGFNAGELIVVAARPSMGKTALVINCIDHAADPSHAPEWLDHPASILFFSLEMGHQSIVRRMLCARARVDAHRLRTGRIPTEDYAELSRAAGELAKLKVFIDDTPGMTAMGMRSRAKRVRAKHGLDLVVVDYLQLMSHPRAESRQQEISQISRSLKEMAREMEVPVIALSQLSRAVESRDDKRPQLSDLRESGSIEQDADVVLLLYRDEYYHRDNPENKGQAEVICAKQRNGPTGVVPLLFNGSIMRFENRAPSVAEPFHG